VAVPAERHPVLTDDHTNELQQLASALSAVGRRVRDAVGAGPRSGDEHVVAHRGGDDVFGVDERAETALIGTMQADVAPRWPGMLTLEGFDEPISIGDGQGPWRFLADPVDGSRPWLAGKRSAWVLLGAGREATTLDALEVSVCVELPTQRAAVGMVASAVRDGGPPTVVDDDLAGSKPPRPTVLRPSRTPHLTRGFVTVARFAAGGKGAIGAWEDVLLAGVETYEDPYLCSGGQLIEVAAGRELAVLDPRPLVGGGFAAHPYDLAGWLVARQAGVIVEALPPGPLDYPLDTTTPCAWAAYANEAIASELSVRFRRAMRAHGSRGTR
jgi:fructose-1,6-bisphosphatase/inositol monophosphatase family enzyme